MIKKMKKRTTMMRDWLLKKRIWLVFGNQAHMARYHLSMHDLFLGLIFVEWQWPSTETRARTHARPFECMWWLFISLLSPSLSLSSLLLSLYYWCTDQLSGSLSLSLSLSCLCIMGVLTSSVVLLPVCAYLSVCLSLSLSLPISLSLSLSTHHTHTLSLCVLLLLATTLSLCFHSLSLLSSLNDSPRIRPCTSLRWKVYAHRYALPHHPWHQCLNLWNFCDFIIKNWKISIID